LCKENIGGKAEARVHL